MDEVKTLNEVFNLHYANANKLYNEGNYEMAYKSYLLASEALMKMSKASSGSLRKTYYEQALKIISIAERANSKVKDGNEELTEFVASTTGQVKFEDIIGLEDVKKAVKTRIISPMLHPEKYAFYRKKSGGGVLLYGPPGTGKTMIARAIATEIDAPFYAIKSSDIVSKWVGDSEKNISKLFEQVKKNAVSVIFIDEVDTLFAIRGNDVHNDRRVNEFLQHIDGFDGKNSGLLLLGATNRPWNIEPATLRSGRFSQKIYVPLPDDVAREYLFKKFLKDIPVESIEIAKLVELTANYSGADIEELCERAKEEPLEKYIETGVATPLRFKDFEEALKSVKPSVSLTEIEHFKQYNF